MKPVEKLLQWIIRLVTPRPYLTIFCALALSGLSIVYTINNLEFETSQKALISPQHRLVQLSETIEQFDDLDRFVVVIENQNPVSSLQFLKALTSRLKADHKHYLQVFDRVDPAAFKKWQLLYLEPDELTALGKTLAEHQRLIADLISVTGLTGFFDRLNTEIASAMVSELFTGFLDDEAIKPHADPFDLSFLIQTLKSLIGYLDNARYLSPWHTFFATDSLDKDQEGYFWTENKRYLLIFVTPKKGEGFNDAQASLKALRDTIAEVKTGFPEIAAGVTGQEALNVDEMAASLGDMTMATILSAAGLAFLLILFWRGVRRPLFEMFELITALCFTFGLTTLIIGHLNILSVVFAPLLLGLGIDYGIHWLARFQETRQDREISVNQAVAATMTELGPSILLAGLVAALSFFPLVLTGFKGLVELGIICSMGMVMTTLTTLCLLPALTLAFDTHHPKRIRSRNQSRPLIVFDRKRSLAIVGTGSILLVIALMAARNVMFDLNMLHLQSPQAESVAWEMKLLTDSKRSSMYGALIARSLAEVREKTDALKKLPTVSEVHSVETLIPENQPEKIAVIRGFKPYLPKIETIEAKHALADPTAIDKLLARIQFKMTADASEWGARTPLENQMLTARTLILEIRRRLDSPDLGQLETRLTAFGQELIYDMRDKMDTIYSAATHLKPMQASDLPDDLIRRFVGQNQVYLIRTFPAQDIWEPENLGRFVHELASVDPDVIGDPVTLYTFTLAFRNACIKAAVYAVIFVSALLLLTLRKPRLLLLAMVPLFAGTLWTLGLMGLCNINLNLANTLFLPLIVGAGVEYGIIIIERLKKDPFAKTVLPFSTGKGIILAGLTTTIGFGSLVISNHQGISSLGFLAMIGSICVMAAAIFFLPAIFALQPDTAYKPAARNERLSDNLNNHKGMP
jgi:hopanoid biosynthesis associated RND transporter like protein HpnN